VLPCFIINDDDDNNNNISFQGWFVGLLRVSVLKNWLVAEICCEGFCSEGLACS
jgi:hypothetical protein